MTTASSIINDSLELMGVASSLTPADPGHQSTGFSILKGMIAEWVNDEIDIILVEPYDSTDDIGEENHMTQTIIALLAKRLAPFLQVELEESAEKLAEIAMDRLLIYAKDPDIVYPDTLPLGQGNRQYSNYKARPYFDGDKNGT